MSLPTTLVAADAVSEEARLVPTAQVALHQKGLQQVGAPLWVHQVARRVFR